MTLAPGMKLGPYEILGPLGAGGMGEVYRARDARLDRDVALKVLPQAVAGDADRLMRFEREAKALAAVNHPNIAQVFGLEEGPSSSRAIVMELIHGDDLSAIIARGPMAVADAIAIARQIAEALEAAHDHGIIHRDLKPGNIKVRTDGTVKVLDFGLAKAAENASTAGGSLAPTITSPAMTHAGVVLGTAAYMSPEQAKGKVVDRRTDIWSFGAVFYEMLTATRAFPGDDVTDTIVSIVSKEPDWSRLPANTPLAVPTLLRRCVIKDPRRRLRDIGEARLVLDDVQSGRVEPAPEMTAVPIWRRMVPIATTVLVMATLGYAAWQLMPIRQNQVVRFSMTLPEDFEFTRSSSRMIDVSRDGSQIVYLGDGQLYLRSLASGATRVLRGTVGVDPATPFFSPDGEWVAFYSVTDGAVKKIAVSGGTSMTICPLGMGVPQFQGGAWEGNTIYFAQHGKGILAVPADGGEPTVVAAVEPNQSVFGPAFLPGGRTLLMAVTGESAAGRWDRADIVAYTPATGDRKVVLRGGGAPRYLPGGYLVYATGSNLVAVPFDTAALEVRGSPVAVVENVRRVFDAASGAAQFAISDEGTLAYIPGSAINPRLSLLAIARLDGSLTVEPLPVAAARYTTPRLSPDGRHIAVTVADEVSSSIWVGELGSKLPLRRLTFGPRDRSVIWSHDSRSVIFLSEGEGQRMIYRQPVDSSGQAERLLAAQTIVAPEAVHPDGKAIVFSDTNGDLQTFTPGGSPQPLVARAGSQRFASFSRDGRWFVYASRQDNKSAIMAEPYPPTGIMHEVAGGPGTGPRWSALGDRVFYQSSTFEATYNVGGLMSVPVRTTPAFSPVGAPVDVKIPAVVTAGFANYDVMPDGKHLLVVIPTRGGTADGRRAQQQIDVVVNWIEELRRTATTR